MSEPSIDQLAPLSSYRKQLDSYVQDYFAELTRQAQTIDPLYAELTTELATYLGHGGKRLRPYLSHLVYLGYGGDDAGAFLPLAATQELFHSWALVHDDVMDRDTKRHGELNISGVYQQKLRQIVPTSEVDHYASAMAILAGDLLMGLAFGHIADQSGPFPPERITQATRRMRQMVFEITAGEQLDILMPFLPASEVSYDRLLRVCQYKTASYSYEAPMQFGAILAGATPAQIDALLGYARPVGIAYQLADDLLGMFGQEDKLGKSTLSDLREGKRTTLMAQARERATTAQRALLDRSFGNPSVDYADLGTVRQILEDCGARKATEDLAMGYIQDAQRHLPELGLREDVTHELALLAEYGFARQL